ncbi:MAG: magnesium transporter [Actinobacteria bacterium]|nr:MAG: magnesium transporter [Actinomycetota bacterium]
MPPQVLRLSTVVKSPLVDRAGDRLGRIEDLIVRLGEDGAYPPITGALAKIGGRELFVPIDQIAGIESGRVGLEGERLSLRRFERRPGEVLLNRDLAARHLINVVGARLVRANEIELACIDGRWSVVGVDTSARPVLRRLLPRPVRRRVEPGPILDWSSIEPFVGHVPTARLRLTHRKLARLHPAQIADLVEAASHDEGEEIIKAVGQDRELEADVFEELDQEHQQEFVRTRSDAEVAALLSKMAPDDVVDFITELDQERRLPVLGLLPPELQRKVRSLLSYNPETAGGLMSPDFLALPRSTPVGVALERVRTTDIPREALGVVYVTDDEQCLCALAPLVALVRADPTASLDDIVQHEPVMIRPDADVHEVVRKMTDYNLSVFPVVDDSCHMIGQITVDDVLELLQPSGWKGDFGLSAPD